MGKSSWDDHFYLRSYEMARAGLTDTEIGTSLGVTKQTFTRWRGEKDALVDALERGRRPFAKEGEREESYLGYVYGRLPKDLRAVWEEMQKGEPDNGCSPKALQRVEEGSKKYLFLHALVEANFSPSRACTKVNLTTQAFYEWLKGDKDFKRLYEEVQWHKGNLFEEKLIERVREGDTPAIIFANKTFNRDRGYGEVHYMEVGGKVEHEHRFSLEGLDLPLEVRKVILQAIKRKEEQGELEEKESRSSTAAPPLLNHRALVGKEKIHEEKR